MISVANWARVIHGVLPGSVESVVIHCMILTAWCIQHWRSTRVKRPRWVMFFKVVPNLVHETLSLNEHRVHGL